MRRCGTITFFAARSTANRVATRMDPSLREGFLASVLLDGYGEQLQHDFVAKEDTRSGAGSRQHGVEQVTKTHHEHKPCLLGQDDT